MHFYLSFITFGLAAVQLAAALPRDYQQPSRRSSVGELNDVLVFDAPAFEDPTNTGNTVVQLQAYVSTPQISIAPFLASVGSFLNETIGLNLGSDLAVPASRLALFATFGLSGKDVSLSVSGCGNEATLQPTADGGMAIQNLSIGACGSSSTLGTVDLSDSRNINFTVFPSSSDGFGVISDIDDTVKVSHTLDKLQLAKATLLDNPVPVTNMPAVYSALAKSLNSPQFIYVSGSPFQLYPFLRDFIATTYADAKGPIMLQNLTTTDLSELLNFAGNDGIFAYKSAMIDRIHGMYPNKKFLAVGDSTQQDPETYGEAIRKYGDFIACAWIRKVDDANNTDARFQAAFQGVAPAKFKIYTDDEILSLANIDVAGGSCS